MQGLARMSGGVGWNNGGPSRSYDGGRPISPGFIARLTTLFNLESLKLDGEQITDASLVLLRAMPNLRLLVIGDIRVTGKGSAELRSARPAGRILHVYWFSKLHYRP
jgi:hypothetical protein